MPALRIAAVMARRLSSSPTSLATPSTSGQNLPLVLSHHPPVCKRWGREHEERRAYQRQGHPRADRHQAPPHPLAFASTSLRSCWIARPDSQPACAHQEPSRVSMSLSTAPAPENTVASGKSRRTRRRRTRRRSTWSRQRPSSRTKSQYATGTIV